MALLLISFGLCLLYWALSQDNDNSEPTQDKTSTNNDNEKINLFKYFLKIIFVCLFFFITRPRAFMDVLSIAFIGIIIYLIYKFFHNNGGGGSNSGGGDSSSFTGNPHIFGD